MLPRFLRAKRLARIFIAPDHISGAIYASRFGKTRFVRTLPAVMVVSETAANAVTQRVQGLNQTLGQFLQLHAAEIDAVELKLSSSLAQFAVCPWPQGIWKTSEVLLYAQARVKEIYGGEVDWVVAIDRARFQESLLIVAINKFFLDALIQTVLNCGLSLRSIKPVLVDVVNHPLLLKTTALTWLSMVEPNVVSVVQLEAGVLQNIRLSHWYEEAAIKHLPTTLAISMGKTEEEILYDLDVRAKTFVPGIDRTRIVSIPGFEYVHSDCVKPVL